MNERYLSPTELASDVVPQLGPHVTLVEVDDEAVLHDARTDLLHRLDAVATTVCRRFGPRRSVAEIVEELTADFSADLGMVQDDVLAMLQALACQRLLVDGRSFEASPAG